jgi:Sap, sulfolipid-1-addressing protein
MLLEAAGLALLAALSPTALLVVSVYLGSDRPRLIATLYLVGALVMSAITGVVILVLLRGTDLSHAHDRSPRYGLRLGLGVVLVVAGIVLARRRAPLNTAKGQGLVARIIAKPAPLTAVLAGVLVFAPGATFLAAVQPVATARADIELTVTALLIIIVLNAALVWLPIVLYIAAPQRTARYLKAFNGWLRANSRKLLVWVLIGVGAIMIGNGIYGITVVR